jgi:hypothetical protein
LPTDHHLVQLEDNFISHEDMFLDITQAPLTPSCDNPSSWSQTIT